MPWVKHGERRTGGTQISVPCTEWWYGRRHRRAVLLISYRMMPGDIHLLSNVLQYVQRVAGAAAPSSTLLQVCLVCHHKEQVP